MKLHPYKQLQAALGQPEGWTPDWATSLERRQIDGRSVYVAQPDRLTDDALTELHHLKLNGWQIIIDAPRLNRLRVSLTQQ